MSRINALLLVVLYSVSTTAVTAEELIRVLIVDGRNNHAWAGTTTALRQILLQTGRFTVDVSTSPQRYPQPYPRRPPKATSEETQQWNQDVAAWRTKEKAYEASIADKWENWRPSFSDYDVVVNNYNGPGWSTDIKADLIRYLHDGGGMVVIHAANNAFADWDDFNQMIGLGWRKVDQGISVTFNDTTGKPVTQAPGDGINSGHGSKHPFAVKTRSPDHPIMKGLPAEWMHGLDELYHSMRGPADGIEILATAYSSPDQRGTGKHEPVVWANSFGRGHIVTNTMGHYWSSGGGVDARNSLHCVGFQTLMVRSCEWAAGATVTIDVPSEFPAKKSESVVHPEMLHWQLNGKTAESAPQAISDAARRANFKKKRNPYALLTPEESVATLKLPDGYRMELVVAEPHISEPVLAVFDGNGRLYVAEMRSYMQDEYGTGTKTLKNGRISRHEDTTGDGRFDRHTVFADNLNLPRMLLPLDDRLAVIETDTTDVVSYRDTNSDGVADERKLLYRGSRKIDSSRSVEHQDSGLVWTIDNWIYLSRGRERYRFTDARWVVDPIEFDWNQWGLDQDDTGRLFFNANSEPLKSFQQHPIYWNQIADKATGRWQKPVIGPDYDPDFLTMHSICQFGDRGEDHAYRSFTSATGGCVFRGNALGADANGNYFICDPTGHILRRAKLTRDAGKIVVSNVYEDEKREFIASPDINFRPVSATTGPDGALYLVDMYRGMIQDAPWVNDQMKAFLRRTGLNFNIHHGRIYRIVHDDHARQQPTKLLDEPTSQLPRHLADNNGWVRDNAQKLIVLRNDRDIVRNTLEEMVISHEQPLARLHALWTLEGCGAITADTLSAALKDSDWRVREAAIRISEPLLIAKDKPVWTLVEKLTEDKDPNVARQLILSLGCCDSDEARMLIDQVIEKHLTSEVVFLSAMTALYNTKTPVIEKILDGSAFRTIKDPATRVNTQRRWTQGIACWNQSSAPARPLDAEAVSLVQNGYQIYAQLCINCHGGDGKGVQLPNQPLKAPPLAGSPRVLGQKELLSRIVLHGLTGPVDNKTYREVMAPSDRHDDKWVASVLSYIRQDWGNLASIIRPADVTAIRKASRNRYRPWTMSELNSYALPELTDRSNWAAASSAGPESAERAINGKSDSCDNPNQPGRWVQVDLGTSHTVTSVLLTASNNDRYPREWELTISADGQSWSAPLASGKGEGAATLISMEPAMGRFLRITQTGQDSHHRWSVTDVKVFGVAGDARLKVSEESWQPPTPAELLALKADSSNGPVVFAKTCVKCHQIEGRGTNFGPDLSKVGARLKKTAILQSILDPGAVVDQKHRGEVVVTIEGKVFSGFIVESTPEFITLRTANNVIETIPVNEIDERQQMKTSFMPSGLDRTMSPQELADLVAWLAERR